MFVFRFKIFSSNMLEGAMVVVQLVEQSPPRPEIRVQIQSLANLYFEHLFTVKFVEKTKMKKKRRPGIAHF